MLEKPDLPDYRIAACLQDAYGLRVADVAFLPLGADLNTAVYRAVADNGAGDRQMVFVKLRRGNFDEIAVMAPKFLSDQGIPQIIAPLPTQTGRLWAELGPFKVILYPFVAGGDGYEVELADRHWIDLGAALKRIHAVVVPPMLAERIPRETYSPRWRDSVMTFLARHRRGNLCRSGCGAHGRISCRPDAPRSAISSTARNGSPVRSRPGRPSSCCVTPIFTPAMS